MSLAKSGFMGNTHALEHYLRRMSEIRRTGAAVKETSFYGALETLCNETSQELYYRRRVAKGDRQYSVGLRRQPQPYVRQEIIPVSKD